MIINYKGYVAMKQRKEWFIYPWNNQSQYIIWLAEGTQREVKQTIDNYINNKNGRG